MRAQIIVDGEVLVELDDDGRFVSEDPTWANSLNELFPAANYSSPANPVPWLCQASDAADLLGGMVKRLAPVPEFAPGRIY